MDQGGKIRRARLRAGLTQSELSRLTGVPQPNISAIERGAVNPKAETVQRLLAAARERPSRVLFRRRRQVIAAARRHGLSDVRVFGSNVHGTDTLSSDIDLLVTARPGVSLFELAAFELEAEGILGYPVDVVEGEGRRWVDRVRSEAVPL